MYTIDYECLNFCLHGCLDHFICYLQTLAIAKEHLNVHFKKQKQKAIFIGYYSVKQGQSTPLLPGVFLKLHYSPKRKKLPKNTINAKV